MPVILCPQCQGKLRMPENIDARRVKCPTCGHVFLSNEARIEGQPPPASKQSRPATRHEIDPLPSRNRKDEVVEFEVIEEIVEPEERPISRSRRPLDDEDTEEDRRPPRRNRREEPLERTPSRRREKANEDDEPEEYPRSRRRNEDDDEDDRFDEDEFRPRRRSMLDDGPAKKFSFDTVRVALLMQAIASWVMGGAMVVMAIVFVFALLGMAYSFAQVLSQCAGIAAIGYVVVSGIASGFCISGPNRNGSMGLAIAGLAVAGARLILVIVVLTTQVRGFGGLGNLTSALGLMTLILPGFGILLYTLIRGVPVGSEFIIVVALAAAEIAQLILVTLYLKAAAMISRDRGGQEEASGFNLFWSIGTGIIVSAGFGLMAFAEIIKSVDFARIGLTTYILCCVGGLGGLYAWHGFVSMSVQQGLDESGVRKRKKKKRRR